LAQDLQKAVKWHRLAAVQEHITLLNLGIIYERGYGQGIRRDYRETVKWLEAEKENLCAQAHLRIMHTSGFGASRNLIRVYM